VVSAIGHEVDFTIADFVADFRAPTPSAAAEKLAPVLRDLELGLRTTESRLRKAVERQILSDRQRLHRAASRLADPRRILGQKQLHLSEQMERMIRCLRQGANARREKFFGFKERLYRQGPQARLRRDRQLFTRWSQRLRSAAPLMRIQQAHRSLLSSRSRLAEKQRRFAADQHRRFRLLEARLDAMSPLKVMTRGYSVVFRKADSRVVRAASEVQVGEALEIKVGGAGCQSLEDCGQIDAQVTAVKPDKSKPPGA
jgi:exodeoxyribonuclease VII large subunit